VAVFPAWPRLLSISAAFFVGICVLTGPGCQDEAVRCYNCDPPWWGPAQSPHELLLVLAAAYQHRNYERFSDLFSTASDSAAYLFSTDDSLGTTWDLTEELRIHRRMFRPEDPLPGETPVPQDLWLVSIDMQMVQESAWAERPDLYRSETNPAGLDSLRWRASQARYQTHAFLKTQGATDFEVNPFADFVVLEDRARPVGENRKFLIYRWVDRGGWTALKRFYAGLHIAD
jgi:hypothetical protein